ncbi:MAG: hypothetical protein LBM93_15050 [Oscillospiraceae bacterium]|jgi:hypothetical protein|nr:hypothetical protein [Oscillospiraceae bacterium]
MDITTIIELLILVIGGSIITVLTYRRSCYDAIWKFYELEQAKSKFLHVKQLQHFPPIIYCP